VQCRLVNDGSAQDRFAIRGVLRFETIEPNGGIFPR
jgi:hypothetical protein